jgi:hypothetical protein
MPNNQSREYIFSWRYDCLHALCGTKYHRPMKAAPRLVIYQLVVVACVLIISDLTHQINRTKDPQVAGWLASEAKPQLCSDLHGNPQMTATSITSSKALCKTPDRHSIRSRPLLPQRLSKIHAFEGMRLVPITLWVCPNLFLVTIEISEQK